MSVLACLLSMSVFSAQAFHGAFENFVTWLRKTERRIQRDDPIKLEEGDLKAGLKHLKVSGELKTWICYHLVMSQ